MTTEEKLARVREVWRQVRPWIDDAADQAFGSDDQWALRFVLELDELLEDGEGGSPETTEPG